MLCTFLTISATLASYYLPFLPDDAMISFRYAQRLAAGKGLTWTDGAPVEGYSDLLWVLLHAPFAFFGFDLIPVTRVIGSSGALAGVLVVALDPLKLRFNLGRAAAGSSYLCLLVPYVVWALAGLEQGFMSGLLVIALVLTERQLRIRVDGETTSHHSRWGSLSSLTLLLAAITLLRADGLLVVALICAGVSLAGAAQTHQRRLGGLILALKMASLPLVAYGGQMAFRLAYYDDWAPNTARAKISVGHLRWEQGLEHVMQGISASSVGIAVALVSLGLGGRQAVRRCLPAICVFFGWLAYQSYVGGDIFPSFRQVLLGLAPLAHVAAVGASEWAPKKSLPQYAVGLVSLAALHLSVQMLHSQNVRTKDERWEWEGSSVGPLLKSAFGPQQPLLAVDAAGALPYWSGLPTLDLLGLNDRFLAHHPPESFGTGFLGHELGDTQYYLDRKVDIFAFCDARGYHQPCYSHSKEMARRKEFKQLYRHVQLEGLPPRRAQGSLFIRIDGKVGITRTQDRVTIPAYFLASSVSGLRAHQGPNGKLAVVVSRETPGVIERLTLPAGHWALQVDGNIEAFRFDASCGGRQAQRVGEAAVLDLEEETDVNITISTLDSAPSPPLTLVELRRVRPNLGLRCSKAPLTKGKQTLKSGSRRT